ncbi:hypothetical protein BDR04DRAFT_1090139 [Suillus decipiens]|nr:hypothetical protein BDR04DRAFT_1090139 [Suillus decipiens]
MCHCTVFSTLQIDQWAPFLGSNYSAAAQGLALYFPLQVQMDPVTSGMAVFQLVQTIGQASAFLYKYVASVRDAPSSCKRLLDQYNSIRGVLATVTDIVNSKDLPDNLCDVLSRLMDDNGPVAKLKSELKNLLPDGLTSAEKMNMKSKLIWPFKEKETGQIADRLKQYYVDITVILAIDSWNTIKDISQGVQELREDSTTQKAHEKAEERRKFLQWMNPVSCDDKHATCSGQRNTGTGRWIFQNNQFVTWNNSDHAFLWLSGQAGHGKTILASSIIDEIRSSGEETLGYFYCNFRDERTTSAAAVLRSLVVELLRKSKVDWVTKIREPAVPEGDLTSLRNLWQQHHDAKPHPTDLRFLRELLVEASTLVHRPVLVIDALDECKDRLDLIKHLASLAEDARLRLLVTGRSEQDIKTVFQDLPTVSLENSAKQMKADIDLHIAEQLRTQKKIPEALRETILKKLSEKAKGMFRWVQCQLDVIVACKTPGSIRKALDDLPAGLDETYDRIIFSIEEKWKDDGPIAQRCLLLLAGAFIPLTLDQLNEAMMIEVGRPSLNEDLRVMDTMDIIAACGSLVAYNANTGIVSLSHYSVKEYLVSRPNKIFKSISDMHARICELLISYVLCDFVDEVCAKLALPDEQDNSDNSLTARLLRRCRRHGYDVADVSKDNPLLLYAIEGCKHLGHVSDEDPDVMTALSRLNSEFCRNTKKHPVLAQNNRFSATRWLSANVTLPSLLFIPLEHGKPWMVESLVKQHPDLLDADIAPGWGSPLIFAIAKRPDCLSIFLRPGVHLNKPSSFEPELYNEFCIQGNSHAPISWAAATRNKVAVDFLLSQTGVDIPEDILCMASRLNELSYESIREFCRRGADVNFTVNGSTPIHSFLRRGASESYDKSQLLPVVKALIEQSCNLSFQDSTARTALHIALDYRLEDIVPYLLEQNAGLSATATLDPDMWSWATNETWFPKVQAAALAADQSCTRIKGKVVNDTADSQIVEFSVAVTADRENRDPICAVAVSAILDSKVSGYNSIRANLSYRNQSLQKIVQDSPKDDSLRFELYWQIEQRVSSRLFDYHQGDKVIRMLQQLDEDKDSTGTSLFLQMTQGIFSTDAFKIGVECILDIYRGPLP